MPSDVELAASLSSDELAQVAGRAWVELQRRAGALTEYVSALAGRRLPVVPGPVTLTSSDEVQLRPPLGLGLQGERHDGRCGLRDSQGSLVCPGCAAVEEIMVSLRHEVSHHVCGSFKAYQFPGRNGNARLHDVLAVLDEPVRLLGIVLEDVRVDRLSGERDPWGFSAQLASMLGHVKNQVSKNQAPQTLVNQENGLAKENLLQENRAEFARLVLVGILADAVGVDVSGTLDAEILSVVQHRMVDAVIGDDFSITEVPDRAVRLFEVLVRLGVFDVSEQQENGEDSDGELGEDESSGAGDGAGAAGGGAAASGEASSAAGEGEGSATGEGEGSGDADSDGADAAGGGGDSAPGGGAEGGLGDSLSEAEIAQAIMAASPYGDEHVTQCGKGKTETSPGRGASGQDAGDLEEAFERVSGQVEELGEMSASKIAGVKVFRAARGEHGRLLKDSVSHRVAEACRTSEVEVGALVGRARRVFADNAAVHRTRDQVRGRVDVSVLGRRAWNVEEKRLFGSRVQPDSPSFSVLIGMDNSGSTVGERSVLLRRCVDAMAQLCERSGVEFGVFAHTTQQQRARFAIEMAIYEVKGFEEPWSPRVRDRLPALGVGDTNTDGSTLRWYRRQVEKRPHERRILLYFTDGAIPGTGGKPEEELMRSEVEACRKAGVTLLGVGVETSSPKDFGIPTVRLDGVADISRVLEFLAAEFGV